MIHYNKKLLHTGAKLEKLIKCTTQ